MANENISIQWFPGHMTKARRMMETMLKSVDMVIECRDARAPLACENPLLAQLIQNKPHLVVLTKADLADPSCTMVLLDSLKNDTTMVIEPIQTGNVDTIDYVPIYDDDLITVYMMADLSDDYGYTIETREDEPVIDITYQNESIAKFTVRHTTTGDSAFLLEEIDYDENGDSIYYGLDHSDHCLNQILLSITK